MAVFLITYDLMGLERSESYEKIINAITDLGSVKKVQYSTWVISGNFSCAQLNKYLTSYIVGRDSVFVAEISSFASTNVNQEAVSLIMRAFNPIPPIKQTVGLLRNPNPLLTKPRMPNFPTKRNQPFTFN